SVGETARFGDLVGGESARRRGNLDGLANQRRRVGGEADFHLRVARHGARHTRQSSLQIVKGRGIGHGVAASRIRLQSISSRSLGAEGSGSKRKTWPRGV